MPPRFTSIGPITLTTFSAFLMLAALLSVGLAAYRLRAMQASPLRVGHMVDAGLGALVGGAIGARLGHVLLAWDYFAGHTGEIVQLRAGGLDWHGAVIGGLLGVAIVTKWRNLDSRALLDALAPAPPLLALAGWTACIAWACGYGAEVDTLARYPSYAVSEAPDVYGIIAPRYNSQLLGIVISLVVFVIALGMYAVPRLYGARLWLAQALLGVGMFAVGFLRGDAVPVIAGLRADQLLDLIIVISCQLSAFSQKRKIGYRDGAVGA